MLSLRRTVKSYCLCGWTMSEVSTGNLKSHVKITMKLWMISLVKITPVTTIIINLINLILAIWLSSVFATTTNPNYTLLGLCSLGTQGFQHWDKWCSYATESLDETLIKVGEFKKNVNVSYLEANQFLVVRLLKPQIYSQRHLSNFRSKKMGAPVGNLDGHWPARWHHHWSQCARRVWKPSPKRTQSQHLQRGPL